MTTKLIQIAFILFLSIRPCAAGSFWATGDEQDLWVIRVDDDKLGFTIFHRHCLDDVTQLRTAAAMQGRLVPDGAVCSDGRLWLVYERTSARSELTVQSIEVRPSDRQNQRQYVESMFHASLPQGVFLRSIAANRRGPWALVRVEDRSTLYLLDHPDQSTPTSGHASPTNRPDTNRSQATTGPSQDVQNPPLLVGASTQPAPLGIPNRQHNMPTKEDRLLRLDRNQWKKVDLPDLWSSEAQSWLVMRHPHDLYPTLVTQSPVEVGHFVQTFEHESNEWTPFEHGATAFDEGIINGHPSAGPARIDPRTATAFAVDGQVLLGLAHRQSKQVQLDLFVLRSNAINPLGTVAIACTPKQHWSVVPHSLAPYGPTATMLTDGPNGDWTWSHINLQGEVTEPANLHAMPWRSVKQAVNWIIMVVMVAVSLLVMLVFWHREPASNRLTLPANVVLADLGWRAVAAIIDLAAPLVAVTILFRIHPKDLFQYHWPGQSDDWWQMFPGGLMIVIFVLYTTVAESFFGTTVGKRLLGMRVTTLDGSPTSLGQAITRNLLKAFDLIVQPMLIMPVLTPYRQRLGDLAARTVVVSVSPNDESPKSKSHSGGRSEEEENDRDDNDSRL